MSDSVQPHRRQPTRLPHPWDSPGKNTGVGCHFLLQCMKVKSQSEVAQSCLTLSDPWTAAYQAPPSMGFSRQEYWSGVPLPSLTEPPGKHLFSELHHVRSSWARDQTCATCIGRWIFNPWTTNMHNFYTAQEHFCSHTSVRSEQNHPLALCLDLPVERKCHLNLTLNLT